MNNAVKIGDFGFATQSDTPDTVLGSLPYQAPEIYSGGQYDNRVDVWAVNTMFYRFLTKEYYFDPRVKE